MSLALIFGSQAQAQNINLAWRTNLAARVFAVDEQTNVYANARGSVIVLNANGQPLQTNSICPLPSFSARDNNGDFYFTGSFDGTNDFGGTILVGGWINGGKWIPNWPTCFLAKYSSKGALLWVVSFGKTSYNNFATDLALDKNGGVYVGYMASVYATVACFNGSTGNKQWETQLDTVTYSSAVTLNVSTDSKCYIQKLGQYLNSGLFDQSGNFTPIGIPPTLGASGNESTNGKPIIDSLNQVYLVGTLFDTTNSQNYPAMEKLLWTAPSPGKSQSARMQLGFWRKTPKTIFTSRALRGRWRHTLMRESSSRVTTLAPPVMPWSLTHQEIALPRSPTVRSVF